VVCQCLLRPRGGRLKRFTDTEKWRDPWFRRLKPEFKLAWGYILDACDNAGVWVVDWDLFSYLAGVQVDPATVLSAFDGRIQDIGKGRWWIPKFISFQFGELVEKPERGAQQSRVHASVLSLMQRHGIHSLWIDYKKGINRGSDTPKDKDKDKDIDKDKDSSEKGCGEKPRPSGVPATEKEAVAWAGMEAVPPDFARDVFHQCDGIGWIDGSQRPITNWRSYIRSRFSRQQKAPPTASGANGYHAGKTLEEKEAAALLRDNQRKFGRKESA
jgi:hypothetical protein